MKKLKIVITLTDLKDLQSAWDLLNDIVDEIAAKDDVPTIDAKIIEEKVHGTSFRAGKEN